MNPIIEQLRRYGSFSKDAEKDIAVKTNHFFKRRGDYFLREGQRGSSYFVLNKGLIRAYFNKNDREVNSWFGEENQIYCSILPVYMHQPSFENIQFLEDSEIYALNSDDLDQLYLIHPELNLIGRKMAEEVCVVLEERITSLHTESAAERYHSLIKQQPNLLKRISLGHIASYLGITQETLSRIRR